MTILATFTDTDTGEVIVQATGVDWEQALDGAYSALMRLPNRPKVTFTTRRIR